MRTRNSVRQFPSRVFRFAVYHTNNLCLFPWTAGVWCRCSLFVAFQVFLPVDFVGLVRLHHLKSQLRTEISVIWMSDDAVQNVKAHVEGVVSAKMDELIERISGCSQGVRSRHMSRRSLTLWKHSFLGSRCVSGRSMEHLLKRSTPTRLRRRLKRVCLKSCATRRKR